MGGVGRERHRGGSSKFRSPGDPIHKSPPPRAWTPGPETPRPFSRTTESFFFAVAVVVVSVDPTPAPPTPAFSPLMFVGTASPQEPALREVLPLRVKCAIGPPWMSAATFRRRGTPWVEPRGEQFLLEVQILKRLNDVSVSVSPSPRLSFHAQF